MKSDEILEKAPELIVRFFLFLTNPEKSHCRRGALVFRTGLAQCNNPMAGIVLWIELLHLKDADFLFDPRTFEKGILVTPGSGFQLFREKPSNAFRFVFSILEAEDMDEVC